MSDMFLKKGDISKLIASVRDSRARFVAPSTAARQTVYKEVSSLDEMTFDYILPRNSYKELVFPQTEAIADFTVGKEGVELKGREVNGRDTVVFGARPCEAASLASLRSVFTWDFIDEFYTKREDRLVVMTIACTKADAACFCTTVELSPESVAGSDISLSETVSGDYLVRAITEKGKAFIAKHSTVFGKKPSDAVSKPLATPEKIRGVDLDRMKNFLSDAGHYENSVWAEIARKCIGCGACTYVCPTCHCFDITDEGAAFGGERRKNWDACQFDHFMLHASGHNPRDAQFKRWRNRFMCKFNYYPNKFSSKGCVGCGRCIRVCPVRLDITEVMEEISK